jgi:hypothetical protein
MKAGSKRRRTKMEIEKHDEEEIKKQESLRIQLTQLSHLKSKVEQLEQENQHGRAASTIVRGFIDAGHAYVDEKGHVHASVPADG